ncbi:hypothetical protein BV20DRAFT_1042454 [Pilatotrama ljubarskyi]|nr:hypothetical protein BV20DRAFT_1042454 [Pilatotrama ljubarskyi]
MQFLAAFVTLAAFTAVVVASPVAKDATSASIVSDAEMAHWIATTDAELTFVGELPNPLAKRSAQTTTVTFCTKSVGPICGGTCTVYTGGATCLDTLGTACISATKDVGFCDESECNGDCSALSQCGTTMASGFCATPNTKSILVSPL